MHHVVAAALVRNGRVLLVHRSPHRRSYPNVWDLPGGHVESGETEAEALRREMREELGVVIATGSATGLCRLELGHGDDALQLGAWLVSEWQGTPSNLAPEEHDEMGWFLLDDLPPLAHEALNDVLAKVTGIAIDAGDP